jgi:hypothetical protein
MTSTTPLPGSMPDILAFPAAALDPAGPAGRAAQGWMREMSEFLAARLEADAAALRDACRCGSITDFAVVQQSWLAEAATAYASAGVRLTEVVLRAAAPAPQEDAPAEAAEAEAAAPQPRPAEAAPPAAPVQAVPVAEGPARPARSRGGAETSESPPRSAA